MTEMVTSSPSTAREQMSALADGQLQGTEFSAAVDLALNDAAAREAWDSFHLVGDLLRSSEMASQAIHSGFTERWKARLEQLEQQDQPVPVAKGLAAMDGRLLPPTLQPTPVSASNDSGSRWKWAAGFLSLAVMAAVGWVAVGKSASDAGFPELAKLQGPASASVVVSAGSNGFDGPQVMERDPRLDELLSAHRQMGGMSALQNPSGFLRNATFQEGGR